MKSVALLTFWVLSILALAAMTFSLTFAGFAAVARPASAHECPNEGCITEGRMTGGGRLDAPGIVTHGFELHCNVNDLPNNLEVIWLDDDGNRNHFHLDQLTDVKCLDLLGISPASNFDLLEAHGTGTYNGQAGAMIYFVFTDASEPSTHDTARIKVTPASGEGRDIGTGIGVYLENGNHQAHK